MDASGVGRRVLFGAVGNVATRIAGPIHLFWKDHLRFLREIDGMRARVLRLNFGSFNEVVVSEWLLEHE